MLPRVQGKPYEADCEWVFAKKLPSGQTATRTTSGIAARDSSGRRLDQQEVVHWEGEGEQKVWTANIYDPISQTLSFVDLRSGTTLMSTPVAASLDEHGAEVPTIEIDGMSAPLALDLPQSADRTLGQQVIEGMNCTGYHREVGAWSVEYWVAEELEATLRRRVIAEDLEITVRVTNILRSEPDPELFVVPPPDPRPDLIYESFVAVKSGLLT